MGTESKPTEKPAKPAKREDAALTEDQLKEVSGGKGTIELSSWQMGIDQLPPGGTGGGTGTGKISLSDFNIKKP